MPSHCKNVSLTCKTVAACSLAFLRPDGALADGSIKLSTPFFDSEHADGIVLSPRCEVTFSATPAENWSASTRFTVSPSKTNEPAKGFELGLKEAQVGRTFGPIKTRVGRILLRHESSQLNESVKTFLRSEPGVDGIGLEGKMEEVSARLLFGGPRVLAMVMHRSFSSFRVEFNYRFERDKITQTLVPGTADTGSSTARIANTHEAEIALKVGASKNEAEALFQLSQQGEQRAVEILDPARGRSIKGELDSNLPKSTSDYRTAVQFKTQFEQDGKSEEWLLASFAVRNSIKYEKESSMSAASAMSQATLGIETRHEAFSAQAGLSADYSASKKFQWFANTLSDGSTLLVKPRWTFWFSTKIKF